eukprot:Rmarinus@m.169
MGDAGHNDKVREESLSSISNPSYLLSEALGNVSSGDHDRMIVMDHALNSSIISRYLGGIALSIDIDKPEKICDRYIVSKLHAALPTDDMILRVSRLHRDESMEVVASDPVVVAIHPESTVRSLKACVADTFQVSPLRVLLTKVKTLYGDESCAGSDVTDARTVSVFGETRTSADVLDRDEAVVRNAYGLVNGDRIYLEIISEVAEACTRSNSIEGPAASDAAPLQAAETIAEKWFADRPDRVAEARVQDLIKCVDMDKSSQNGSMLGDQWEIDAREIVVVRRNAGVGKTAVVHHALWRYAEVAFKQFNYVRLSDSLLEMFRKEVALLSQLRHPNVVTLVGATTRDKEALSIITEWLPRGSLNSLIKDPSVHFEWRHIKAMVLDIARGMAYLHDQRVIHRDLKSHNLLIDEHWRVKIADFGLGKQMSSDTSMAFTECGTSGWVAPEVLDPPLEGYTSAVDVFSFGVCCWEIVTRARTNPFAGLSPVQYYKKVTQTGGLPLPDGCPQEFVDLVRRCWRIEPSERPTFTEILHDVSNFSDDHVYSPSPPQ